MDKNTPIVDYGKEYSEDFTPMVGFADDLGALAAASGAVLMHIKPEHEAKAKQKLTQWFD